jgi:hypothetical protein
MYKSTKRELLEARENEHGIERLTIAVEHLSDILDNRDRKRLNDTGDKYNLK